MNLFLLILGIGLCIVAVVLIKMCFEVFKLELFLLIIPLVFLMISAGVTSVFYVVVFVQHVYVELNRNVIFDSEKDLLIHSDNRIELTSENVKVIFYKPSKWLVKYCVLNPKGGYQGPRVNYKVKISMGNVSIEIPQHVLVLPEKLSVYLENHPSRKTVRKKLNFTK